MRTTVKQYPSILTWKTQGTPDSQDEDGNIIPGEPGEEFKAKCRYENFQGSNRKEMIGRDGKTVLATGSVYIKFGEPKPSRFTIGKIETEGEEIYSGEIMNTFEGQLNKTIYTVEYVGS
ncbi:MAG: hypothetical protein LBF27_25835 [Sphingobacterium sp.]|jgi:hypothetical protein|nr:hypothetical protein [Sphingobacterium sp.]